MTDYTPRILVVDDEEDLCEILKFNLESQGFAVDTANSAEEALMLNLSGYDLIILDVMMGGMSGFRFAQKIQKESDLKVPIIFLTARDTENDLLTGFNLGADDYMAKPFSINELTARVKAVLRRATGAPGHHHPLIESRYIRVNLEKKSVIIDAEEIDLPRKEFEILHLLMKYPGRIFTREEILYRVWSDDVIINERTVDVHITRLRKKMGLRGSLIRNKPGYGYYYEPVKE